jgi:CBS domain-containing protein
MLVSQVLAAKGAKVLIASPEQTLEAVASILWSRKIGALVVTENDDVVGIVSERDLVRAVAEEGEGGLNRKVRDAMTRDVVLAAPSDSVEEMLSRMTDRRIRHLPVCEHHRLIGIVSIGDLVKVKIEETEAEAQHLRAYIAS